jgi:hypothetical protein
LGKGTFFFFCFFFQTVDLSIDKASAFEYYAKEREKVSFVYLNISANMPLG